jgi:hypothetical protein
MRKDGFYWVKYEGEWTVGKFFDSRWIVLGGCFMNEVDDFMKDSDFSEIDECGLVRHEILIPIEFDIIQTPS